MAHTEGLDDELPEEFTAVSPSPDDTSSFEQEYHDYMDEVEQLSGLEIEFTPDMPDQFAGVTVPTVFAGDQGNQITGSNIWISDRYLDTPSNPANFNRYAGTLHHELVHGAQFQNMALTPERFNRIEKSYLQLIHEGQASFNGDGNTYSAVRDLYGDFYEQIKDMDDSHTTGRKAADLLEELSEDNYMHLFYLENGDEDVFYDALIIDRDRANGMNMDEIYELADDRFDADVIQDDGYAVDFRDVLVDTEKIGRHIVEVQEWMENYYSRLQEENLAMPSGAKNNLEL